jgi:hypothetical protein
VADAGRLFGDQYLDVIGDLATLRAPVRQRVDVASVPDDFLASLAAIASRTSDTRVVWGAASKGVIFSLLMNRVGIAIDVAVDINPAKQGKYLASTGVPIASPEDALRHLPPGADVYVMNGNYLDEVQEITRGRFDVMAVDHAVV